MPTNAFPNLPPLADPAPEPPSPPASTDWKPIILALIGFATVVTQQQCNHTATVDRVNDNKNTTIAAHDETVKKIEKVEVKADDAATTAAATKETVAAKAAVVDAKLENLKTTLTATPAAVAAEVAKKK